MRGTATRDYDAINSALEDVAADLSFSSSFNSTSFSGKALAEDLSLLLDLFADVIQRPTFPEDHVERLRGELLTVLNYRQQDTRYRARLALYEALYPMQHPYHYSPSGRIESISHLTVDDLRAFHVQHYTPAGAILVIAGAVRAEDAFASVESRLGTWSAPARVPRPEVAAPTLPAETRISRVTIPGKTQSDIAVGRLAPGRRSPDYDAVRLINSILGQFGMMGRIGHVVRETLGLAYYAYSQLEGTAEGMPWAVFAGVNPKNVDLTIARITDELRRITDELVTEDDLADNKAYFIGNLPLQLESNEGIANMIRTIAHYNLGLDYLVMFRERIEALTPEELRAAARRYMNADALVVGIAGP